MTAVLEEMRRGALLELEKAETLAAVECWRLSYLGKKGAVAQALARIPGLPPADRRSFGAAVNDIKRALEAALEERRKTLQEVEVARSVESGRIDVTLPGRRPLMGGLHPVTKMVREICAAFASMGFQVVEGPEVEWDYYNFEALNIPKDHPARDMWDTFWMDYKNEQGDRPMLLRTHTSPMQIRVMEKTRPPVRVVVPGRCYRYEATDATHESMLYQIEGLAVDEGITLADLKGTLYEFAKKLFGKERRVRFRCDYFPFVEPGAEMAIDCFACQGKGCRLCSDTGWIEILGAGMVHPDVLRRVGYDPDVFTGFAFGLGAERVTMLRYDIEDIRHFYANDLRFLRQF